MYIHLGQGEDFGWLWGDWGIPDVTSPDLFLPEGSASYFENLLPEYDAAAATAQATAQQAADTAAELAREATRAAAGTDYAQAAAAQARANQAATTAVQFARTAAQAIQAATNVRRTSAQATGMPLISGAGSQTTVFGVPMTWLLIGAGALVLFTALRN